MVTWSQHKMIKTADERMAVIETEITNINKTLDNHIKDQRKDFDTVFDKIDNLNKSFAGKWVEKVSVGILILTIAGVIMFVITGG